MKKCIFVFVILFLAVSLSAQTDNIQIKVSDDIYLEKLSDRAYLHVSYQQTADWGKVSANGFLLIEDGEAFMFDTPWNDQQTEILYNWLAEAMNIKVVAIIPNHWHEDCMGGLAFLHSKGVRSYASQITINIAQEKGLPVPQQGFDEFMGLNLNGIEILCYYPGAGHAIDNIVVWIPSEKILFPGCMVKDLTSQGLGNVVDGDVNAWPGTIDKVIKRFPNAYLVIPGHGKPGGTEILTHTRNLLSKE